MYTSTSSYTFTSTSTSTSTSTFTSTFTSVHLRRRRCHHRPPRGQVALKFLQVSSGNKHAVDHHEREVEIATRMLASGAQNEEAFRHLCFPSECFASSKQTRARPVKRLGGLASKWASGLPKRNQKVLMYQDQLVPFDWRRERTSNEWFDVARQGEGR